MRSKHILKKSKSPLEGKNVKENKKKNVRSDNKEGISKPKKKGFSNLGYVKKIRVPYKSEELLVNKYLKLSKEKLTRELYPEHWAKILGLEFTTEKDKDGNPITKKIKSVKYADGKYMSKEDEEFFKKVINTSLYSYIDREKYRRHCLANSITHIYPDVIELLRRLTDDMVYHVVRVAFQYCESARRKTIKTEDIRNAIYSLTKEIVA